MRAGALTHTPLPRRTPPFSFIRKIEFIFVFTAENCLAIRMCAFIRIIQRRIWNKAHHLVEHIPRMI